jgi:Fe-S oxidoreductase
MDLCLSCKGCKGECPSNVDVAKLKAEFLQHYYDANGVPLRSRLIANFTKSAQLGSLFPAAYNFFMTAPGISTLVKKLSGFATERSMPTLQKHTLKRWYKQRNTTHTLRQPSTVNRQPRVYLFADEFTNYNDTHIGIKAIELLERLGYEVIIPHHIESGRTWLSKGLLRQAKVIANTNIELLSSLISESTPLIGIEPSAILAFRDEYPDLATDENLEASKQLASNALLIDEFLAREIDKGNIRAEQFTTAQRSIKLHGHCQQKAVASVAPTVKILSLPANYSVQTIPSGCCGMAGSFGYEKEHYELSMKIGELVLFPAVRNAAEEVIIAAPGTSCRHQVKDGTGRKALHPVEVLWEALV